MRPLCYENSEHFRFPGGSLSFFFLWSVCCGGRGVPEPSRVAISVMAFRNQPPAAQIHKLLRTGSTPHPFRSFLCFWDPVLLPLLSVEYYVTRTNDTCNVTWYVLRCLWRCPLTKTMV